MVLPMTELLSPHPALELGIGILILIVIIFVHGTGMRMINRRFARAWEGVKSSTSHFKINALLAAVVASLAVVHLLETLIWAVPLYLTGIIPSMRDSYYYVLESYTTLGEGNVTLPEHWRLIGPIIAMSGLFTFGWTASVLVNVMNEFGRNDKVRAQQELD